MNNDKEWQIDVTTDRKRVGDLFRRKNPTCANILSCGEAEEEDTEILTNIYMHANGRVFIGELKIKKY